MVDATANGVPAGTRSPGDTLLEGRALKQQLARATRMSKIRTFGLVVPLLAFILIFFVAPIAEMLFRSVDNRELGELWPNVTSAIVRWDGNGLPDEETFAALAQDLTTTREDRTIGRAATRLNRESAGMRSLVTGTGRKLERAGDVADWKAWFLEQDADWGKEEIWGAIKVASAPYTAIKYLNSLDYQINQSGAIVPQPEERQIYQKLFLRTFWMSVFVTLACLVLGFPVAHLLSTLPLRKANLLMILVLLPFWTSLLVRTTSWIALLQSEGVVNDILVWAGILSDTGRIQMMYNQIGTVIAMTHILLPFMVLPMFSVMKTISPNYMRAAQSLGATPLTAFIRVYVPQTIPGVGAGCLLVFILAIGYYITPALVGGQTGQMISNMIAFHMQKSLDWAFAGALGAILLAGVLVLYWLFNKAVGIDKLKLG